jgi:hypothetical protein
MAEAVGRCLVDVRRSRATTAELSLSLNLRSAPPTENIEGALKNETGRDSTSLVEPERGARSAAGKTSAPSGEGRGCSGSICPREDEFSALVGRQEENVARVSGADRPGNAPYLEAKAVRPQAVLAGVVDDVVASGKYESRCCRRRTRHRRAENADGL